MTGSRPGCRRVLRLVRRRGNAAFAIPGERFVATRLRRAETARQRAGGGPRPAALARVELGRRGQLAPESRAIEDGGAAARVGLGCRRQLAPERRPARRRTSWGGFAVTARAKSPRTSITPTHNHPRRLSPSPSPAQWTLTPATADASSPAPRRPTRRRAPGRGAARRATAARDGRPTRAGFAAGRGCPRRLLLVRRDLVPQAVADLRQVHGLKGH
jgi:hypothetical protein